MEKGSSLGALKRNLIGLIFFSSFYHHPDPYIPFCEHGYIKTFEKTWLIAVGGAFIYLVYFSASTYGYAQLFNFKRLKRWGILLIYASLVPIFYVFPSLYLSVVYSKSIWRHSWITVLILAFFYIVTDYLLNRRLISTFQRLVQLYSRVDSTPPSPTFISMFLILGCCLDSLCSISGSDFFDLYLRVKRKI